jgi:hypothetical protein
MDQLYDTGYGSAEMLNWLVHERGIEPHIPVFDKSKRTDGTFSREDFTYDHASDTYRCPAGKILQHYRRRFTSPRAGVSKDNLIRYRASMHDCGPCPLKPRCCPNAPARKVLRSIYEGARETLRARSPRPCLPNLALSAKKGRDAVRPPQTHSEARQIAAVRPLWRPRPIPPCRHRPKPAQTGQADPRTTGDPCRLRREPQRRAPTAKSGAAPAPRLPLRFSTQSTRSGRSVRSTATAGYAPKRAYAPAPLDNWKAGFETDYCASIPGTAILASNTAKTG